jgi:hypothetical protein
MALLEPVERNERTGSSYLVQGQPLGLHNGNNDTFDMAVLPEPGIVALFTCMYAAMCQEQ